MSKWPGKQKLPSQREVRESRETDIDYDLVRQVQKQLKQLRDLGVKPKGYELQHPFERMKDSK